MTAGPPTSAVLLAASLLDEVQRLIDNHRDVLHLYWDHATSPWHLALAVSVFLALFFGRLIRASHRVRRARAAIPLVIGGWGTRGKSGTERKKSALLHALGAEVLTKTTGCEAMVIHSQPGQKPLELFIYRPYDKATIWEQRDMVELARDLGADAFLYECMALNPQYVRIIQHGWMGDDLSTITNAYPDHEDIQGPTGLDLPYVMSEFMPSGTVCFTAEETMLPVLRSGARKRGSELIAVTWRDAFLVPEDVLARYPYQVHPMNIALVTRMAEHLGVERELAWKEIADHIVPDLGVLKVFPVAAYRGRRLEFSNGHSANERHGFNANWRRLGLDGYDAVAQPDRWLVTVVNNRGDRIARSKVFADCLTQDVRAHAHFLIGTNLTGLAGYVRAALDSRLAGLRLLDPDLEKPVELLEDASQRLDRELRELMLEAPTAAALARKVEAMLAGVGLGQEEAARLAEDPQLHDAITQSPVRAEDMDPLLPPGGAPRRDPTLEAALAALESRAVEAGVLAEHAAEVAAWADRYARELRTVQAFRGHLQQTLADGPPSPDTRRRLDEALRDLIRGAFRRKLVALPDPHITGDAIIDAIARHTPPGLHVHIHGCQNIKGPGLDWCYRWINLEAVTKACRRLEDPRAWARMDALVELSTNNDYGIIDAPIALEAIDRARERPPNQDMAFQTQASLAREHIGERYQAARQRLEGRGAQRGPTARLLAPLIERLTDGLEALLDAGDSKTRRRQADAIFRDLVEGRIAHERAAAELRAITKRQKGGWLRRALEMRLRRLRASIGLPERPDAGGRAGQAAGGRD